MPSFRYAQTGDTENIVSLVESAYRGEISRQGWTTEADLIDGQRTDFQEVSEILNQTNNYIILYENERDILASVHLANNEQFAYLGMFAVRPDCQGQGIGKRLLAEAERIAFDLWQCSSVVMTVISLRKDLINWYRRHGYYSTNQFKPFPYGQPRYGLPRRKDLVFEVLEKQSNTQ